MVIVSEDKYVNFQMLEIDPYDLFNKTVVIKSCAEV